MGKVKWSPKLQHCMDKLQYIRSTISKQKKCKISSRFLMRLSRKVGLQCECTPMERLEEMLYHTKKEYLLVKKNHDKERMTYLEELAEALERSGK